MLVVGLVYNLGGNMLQLIKEIYLRYKVQAWELKVQRITKQRSKLKLKQAKASVKAEQFAVKLNLIVKGE